MGQNFSLLTNARMMSLLFKWLIAIIQKTGFRLLVLSHVWSPTTGCEFEPYLKPNIWLFEFISGYCQLLKLWSSCSARPRCFQYHSLLCTAKPSHLNYCRTLLHQPSAPLCTSRQVEVENEDTEPEEPEFKELEKEIATKNVTVNVRTDKDDPVSCLWCKLYNLTFLIMRFWWDVLLLHFDTCISTH